VVISDQNIFFFGFFKSVDQDQHSKKSHWQSFTKCEIYLVFADFPTFVFIHIFRLFYEGFNRSRKNMFTLRYIFQLKLTHYLIKKASEWHLGSILEYLQILKKQTIQGQEIFPFPPLIFFITNNFKFGCHK